MPSASMAKTAGVHVRCYYTLWIGSQDITTIGSFSGEFLQLVPVLIIFLSLLSFHKTGTRSRVMLEGKLGLFLPLASVSLGLPG